MLSVLRSTSVEEAEYGAVVLPFTVLRRLECVMEPRREVMSEVVTPHETEQQRRTQLTIRTRSADNVGLSFWATSDYNQVRTHRRRGGRDVRRFVLDYDQAGCSMPTSPPRLIGRPDRSPVFHCPVHAGARRARTSTTTAASSCARWSRRCGLRPSWAKEKGPRPINARYETVTTNGMFRGSFTSQRVVVPMTGYYEWVEQKDGTKQPYFVHPNDGGLLNAAGLSAARRSEGGESWDITFTIITREAKDAAGEVHDRMPAYLPSGKLGEWLAPGKPDDDEKADLHQGLGEVSEEIAATLVTHPVSREVNNARKVDRTDPSLIEPIELG